MFNMDCLPTNCHPSSHEDIAAVRGALNPKTASRRKALLEILMKVAENKYPCISQSAIFEGVWHEPATKDYYLKKRLNALVQEVNAEFAKLPLPGLRVGVRNDAALKGNPYWLSIEHRNSAKPKRITEQKAAGLFCWSAKPIKRKLEISVPCWGETEVRIRPLDGTWVPPSGFSGYSQHRLESWGRYEKLHPKTVDSWVWHVDSFTRMEGYACPDAIELMVRRIRFADYVATTWRLDDIDLTCKPPEGTIRRWLEEHRQSTKCTHFIPAGNLLAVEVAVISNDNEFIVRQEKQGGRWEPAVFGYMDALRDVSRTTLYQPEPSETAFRKATRILGIPFSARHVVWTGVGFGKKKGNVRIFGELKIPRSSAEIIKESKEKGRPELSAEFKAIPATPEGVYELLNNSREPHRLHFEVLLALSLARQSSKTRILTL